MNILFVCTGNTCRSPMAEHVFRHLLKQSGRADVGVSSAGVMPSPRVGFSSGAAHALTWAGLPPASHTPRGLDAEKVAAADLILVMEPHHRSAVISRFPDALHKTHVLKPFAGIGGSDGIEDPFGEAPEAYIQTLEDIKQALLPLLTRI